MSEPVLAQAEWRHVEDFRLGAADFAVSAAGMSWRWVLTQPGGAFLDDHVVRLDSADWQYQAFTDPYGWIEYQPDSAGDRMASERRAVAGLGDWIAGRVSERRLSEAVPVYAAPDQDVCGVDM